MNKKEIELIYNRFFNSRKKSPYPDRSKGQFPKHVSIAKSREVLIWDSRKNGTYLKSVHGAIKEWIRKKK